MVGVGETPEVGTQHNIYLLRNNGDNTFADEWDSRGFSGSPIVPKEAIRALDYDDDGDLDLAFQGSHFALWQNQGTGWFADVTTTAFPSSAQLSGWGLTTGDYDNDGDLDILVASIHEYVGIEVPHVLYRNNGDGTFEDVTDTTGDLALTNQMGWPKGTEFFDYDNDGDLDIHMTSEAVLPREGLVTVLNNSVFRNEGDGTFTRVNDLAFGAGIRPRAGAAGIGDIDRDGALDLYVPSSDTFGGLSSGGLLRNHVGSAKNYLQIELVSTESAPGAHGARILVEAGGLTQMREVVTSALDEDYVHFGLGDATQADRIEIRWPLGIVQVLHNISANQRRVVRETAQDCPGSQDDDGDGVCNEVDNCSAIANGAIGEPTGSTEAQCDTDNDGYGNACDPDVNNDGIIGGPDYGPITANLGQPRSAYPGADVNCDGVIGGPDYAPITANLGGAPGPSGLECAGTIPCP